MDSVDGFITPWTLTNPKDGNRWRAIADGARVYSFPIWLYCDDTSGNLSKKWNKHNSFLFTPAGLPRRFVHQEYNVHFLCTSNIAPPLEMLDGIVDQLESVPTRFCYVYEVLKFTYTAKHGIREFGHGTLCTRNGFLSYLQCWHFWATIQCRARWPAI